MPLTPFGRLLFGAVAALMLWLVVGALRRHDAFGAVLYGVMLLLSGIPALVGRDVLAVHRAPAPRWLRWLFAPPP